MNGGVVAQNIVIILAVGDRRVLTQINYLFIRPHPPVKSINFRSDAVFVPFQIGTAISIPIPIIPPPPIPINSTDGTSAAIGSQR